MHMHTSQRVQIVAMHFIYSIPTESDTIYEHNVVRLGLREEVN